MNKANFYDLVKVMDRLRDDGGCPWDREQDSDSLKSFLVEETYEVLEAIDCNDPENIKEELGDLLYQILFHARIAKENSAFDMDDVINTIYDKMVRRHPHVFASEIVRDSQQVLENWEKIKMKEKEKENSNSRKSVLEGVPKELPSLLRALSLQNKAARVGFDWDDAEHVLDKLEEEIDEFKTALLQKNKEEMAGEMGDILFVLVNISRHLGIDPEDALRRCIDKFIRRFQFIEKEVSKMGLMLKDVSLNDMGKLWEKAKCKTI